MSEAKASDKVFEVRLLDGEKLQKSSRFTFRDITNALYSITARLDCVEVWVHLEGVSKCVERASFSRMTIVAGTLTIWPTVQIAQTIPWHKRIVPWLLYRVMPWRVRIVNVNALEEPDDY